MLALTISTSGPRITSTNKVNGGAVFATWSLRRRQLAPIRRLILSQTQRISAQVNVTFAHHRTLEPRPSALCCQPTFCCQRPTSFKPSTRRENFTISSIRLQIKSSDSSANRFRSRRRKSKRRVKTCDGLVRWLSAVYFLNFSFHGYIYPYPSPLPLTAGKAQTWASSE